MTRHHALESVAAGGVGGGTGSGLSVRGRPLEWTDGRRLDRSASRPPCRSLTRLDLPPSSRRTFAATRPRHVQADPQAQADLKQRLRPLLRTVANAFPQATVELRATDEHRIGLKPILRPVWTLPDQRPIAPVEHRYAWRYLVGFVHPTSGRTVWHLATAVSTELFSVELLTSA
jgi:hypothetical protein